MAAELHARDRCGSGKRLTGARRQPDAACFATPSDSHLGFDGDRSAELVGEGSCLASGVRKLAPWHHEASHLKEPSASAFQEVHSPSFL